MYFERLINTIDIYHQKKIINYLKKLKIDVIIDVGAHKGEFLSYCLQLNKKLKFIALSLKKIFFKNCNLNILKIN